MNVDLNDKKDWCYNFAYFILENTIKEIKRGKDVFKNSNFLFNSELMRDMFHYIGIRDNGIQKIKEHLNKYMNKTNLNKYKNVKAFYCLYEYDDDTQEIKLNNFSFRQHDVPNPNSSVSWIYKEGMCKMWQQAFRKGEPEQNHYWIHKTIRMRKQPPEVISIIMKNRSAIINHTEEGLYSFASNLGVPHALIFSICGFSEKYDLSSFVKNGLKDERKKK